MPVIETTEAPTAEQKKAWAAMVEATDRLMTEQGAAVMLCLAAFAEGHLVARVSGNYGDLPPDARKAMEALAFQVRCVLEAHARQRGGVPIGER